MSTRTELPAKEVSGAHASLALAALAGSLAIVAVAAAPAAGGGFDDERPAGYDINPKHQSNWEPVVAVDPNHANRVYQLITGINAPACKGNCPGTSVLFRRSTDGGASFGPETFVCAAACKTIGWQYDPQIRVANDTNAGCSCGTIYAAFLDQFDPGVQLFTSHDGGEHVECSDHDERRTQLHGQAHPRDLPIGPGRLRGVQPQVRQHGRGLA